MRVLDAIPDERLDLVQCALAAVLLGLSLPALARAYARAWSTLYAPRDGVRNTALGAHAVGAALRWLAAPHWIVTIFIGYRLAREAIDLLPVSYYGVGAPALYHALFALLPRDHRTLLWVNSVIGVASAPLMSAYVARLMGDRRVGAAFAALVACVPLFIKNDNSDANNVPCLWWLFGALLLWEEYLDTRAPSALVWAAALGVLAATVRPEMPVLAALLAVLTAYARGPGALRDTFTDRRVGLAALATGVALGPHLLHVMRSVNKLSSDSGGNGVDLRQLWRVPILLLRENAILQPGLYPLALAVLAGAALALGRDAPERRRVRAVLAMTCVALTFYYVDLCRANIARVQVPGALFATALAAFGLVRAWDLVRRPAVRVAGLALVAASIVPGAISLWAPTNEQAEEDFLREAAHQLPTHEPAVLLRVGWEDRVRDNPLSEQTHQHFPDYLFEPPAGSLRTSSLSDWLARPTWNTPVYFFMGMRCYARMRAAGTPPPRGENLHPACARLRDGFRLEPLAERTVPNRGDVWLEYYGDAPSLRMGLYRVRPRDE